MYLWLHSVSINCSGLRTRPSALPVTSCKLLLMGLVLTAAPRQQLFWVSILHVWACECWNCCSLHPQGHTAAASFLFSYPSPRFRLLRLLWIGNNGRDSEASAAGRSLSPAGLYLPSHPENSSSASQLTPAKRRHVLESKISSACYQRCLEGHALP